MSVEKVIYLCINLLWSEKRRESILAQAERLGLNIQLVAAVAGKELSPAQRACYDEEHTRLFYNYKLTDNEIACVLSHRKALETFLESDAEYGVVLEDDAILADCFNEGIRELTENLSGWEVVKLQLPAPRHMRPLPLPPGNEASSTFTPIFSTRFSSQSVGFMYTRHAARIICEAMQRFYLPADSMIGQIILDKQLPVIAMCPELVTQEGAGFESEINLNDSSLRGMNHPRSFGQYLRHRMRVYTNNLRRRKLYRMVKHKVHRVE